jgi:dihydrofolate synthase/folylpolyglutamate synthase
MSIAAAIEFIEFTHSFGSRLDLPAMKMMLHQLGDPHQRLKVIHVAGTNGKGSTSSFLSSMLMAQGYRTGLFTSPHMHCYTERIRVNGASIPEEAFISIIDRIKELIMPMIERGECSYPAMFDLMTLSAFVYFDRMLLDVVVLEVGLGGLFDATNVIDNPLAAVITPIDIDHVDILGSDLAGIAAHKAGIIKPLRPVVYHHQVPLVDEIIRTTALRNQAPSYCLQPHDVTIHNSNLKEQIFDFSHPLNPMTQLTTRMMGNHQANNASLALLTLLALRHHGLLEISDEALTSGLQQSFWAGRLEVLHHSPLVIIDGAHNLQGAQILQQFLVDNFPDRKIHFLIGMLNNKDISGVLNTLLPLGQKLFFTNANNPKAVNPATLAEQVQLFGKEVFAIDSMSEAVEAALMQTSADEVLVITGSLYLVGDAKTILLQFLDQQREAS